MLRSCFRPGTTRPQYAIRVLSLTWLLFAASSASAATDFIVWTSPTGGAGGGISASVTSTVTAGSLVATTVNASEASFVSDFAASYSTLFYRSPSSGPASISSTLSFVPPLPSGARLLAVDLDFSAETFTLSSSGTPLSLLQQRETIDGASSEFPAYSPGTGVLSTTAATQNDNEAAVFDVSGLSAIDVDFSGGSSTSGSFIAIAVPIQPVPGPGPVGRAALALALGIALLVLARRQACSPTPRPEL